MQRQKCLVVFESDSFHHLPYSKFSTWLQYFIYFRKCKYGWPVNSKCGARPKHVKDLLLQCYILYRSWAYRCKTL